MLPPMSSRVRILSLIHILLREEQLRAVEEHLTSAVRAAHLGNLDETEFLDIAKTLFEEEI